MKQIALVLALTALAALGFVVARWLNQPAAVPGTALTPPPPVSPPSPPTGPARGPQGQATILPRTDPAERARAVDWKAMAARSWQVDPADGWIPDLSAVDFEAELLCRMGSVEIRRDDFRKYVCLTVGRPLIEARLTWLQAAESAREKGLGSIELGAEAHARIQADWAAERGLDPELVPLAQALLTRMPAPAAMELRRLAIEALLGQFRGVHDVAALPPGERALMVQNPEGAETLNRVLASVQDGLAGADEGEHDPLLRAVKSLDTLMLFYDPVRQRSMQRRSYTFLDGTTRPGVVAALATGDLPDKLMPPWLLPGEIAEVPLDYLWPLLGPGLDRMALEQCLVGLLFIRSLEHELERAGQLPEPEAAWRAYFEEYVASLPALMDLTQIAIMMHGFPSMGHYRAIQRLRRGYERGLPQGWDGREALRAFYEDNRFQLQSWEPDLEVIVFPAQLPEDGDSILDWNAAREQAEAMAARIAEGADFSGLRSEHHGELHARFRAEMGEVAAAEFIQRFPVDAGRIPLGHLRQVLLDSRFEEVVRCYSPILSAPKVLEVGEVSPPWRTGFGYVLVRILGARLSGLEPEFEDVEETARFFQRDLQFARWANGVLASQEFEVPTEG